MAPALREIPVFWLRYKSGHILKFQCKDKTWQRLRLWGKNVMLKWSFEHE
jgi:hypothetical protein